MEWGQFLHIDKKFTDFHVIRKEIVSLRIHSPILDLTLVDLPGLTKVGARLSLRRVTNLTYIDLRRRSTERQIRNLVLDFISKPNRLIIIFF